MKKSLVFPGAFQFAGNYRGFDGVDIWLSPNEGKAIPPADYYIGHSLGASFLLAQKDRLQGARFIFINPLLEKKSTLGWLYRWTKFHLAEGMFRDRLVPITQWGYAMRSAFALLRLDTIAALEGLSKKKVLIIRGKDDRFFFNRKSAENIRKKGFKVIEVETGHSWNENVGDAVTKAVRDWLK